MEQDLATLQVISETLKEDPQASQRTLAKKANMSLGMMNAILGRFVERGWIMLTNVNARKLAYALTVEGISELSARSKRFAKRTFQLANQYNEDLNQLVSDAKSAGKTKVVLYGKSYIKFLLEYAASKNNLQFEEQPADAPIQPDGLCLLGELEEEEVQRMAMANGCICLLEVLDK